MIKHATSFQCLTYWVYVLWWPFTSHFPFPFPSHRSEVSVGKTGIPVLVERPKLTRAPLQYRDRSRIPNFHSGGRNCDLNKHASNLHDMHVHPKQVKGWQTPPPPHFLGHGNNLLCCCCFCVYRGLVIPISPPLASTLLCLRSQGYLASHFLATPLPPHLLNPNLPHRSETPVMHSLEAEVG